MRDNREECINIPCRPLIGLERKPTAQFFHKSMNVGQLNVGQLNVEEKWITEIKQIGTVDWRQAMDNVQVNEQKRNVHAKYLHSIQ